MMVYARGNVHLLKKKVLLVIVQKNSIQSVALMGKLMGIFVCSVAPRGPTQVSFLYAVGILYGIILMGQLHKCNYVRVVNVFF